MTLDSVQKPYNAALESCEKNLVDWNSSYLISIKKTPETYFCHCRM